MTRLQKKCLVAVAVTHLLLVVALLCSGFIKPRPKPDDSQVLTVIPANIIAAALVSGVRDAQPPPPQPIVKPPEPIAQPPPLVPVKPPVKPAEPPKPVEPVKPPDVTLPEPKPKEHKIEISLTPVVRKTTPVDNSAEEKKAADAAQREAKRRADAKAQAFKSAATSIRNNMSPSMNIEMPADLKGDSSVAYANFASIVKTVYTDAWQPPQNADNDEANVKVSVTIANTGRVISTRIIDRSGDAGLDQSVQRTLDRVSDMGRPFEDGATDKERTYIINFNLKAKRMLG